MEIIQTIWTALTTENAQFLSIVSIPYTIIEISLTCYLFTLLLNIIASKTQKFLYVLFFSTFSIISGIFITPPYNSLFNLIISVILIYYLFRLNFLKCILAELLPLIIFSVVNIPLHNIYVAIFNLPTNLLMVIPIYKLSFASISYLIIFFICIVFKHYKINIYLLDNMKQRVILTLVINFIFGIAAVYIQTYISSLYSDIIPPHISLLNVCLLLFYFIFSLYSLIRTNSLEKTRQDLEQSQQYNKTLTILHDNIRCFKHDFNNIVTTIGGYVQSGDMDGLKKYYTELQGDCQKVNNLSALSPSVINEPAIYSLLANKYHLADANGITINLEVFIDLTELKIKPYEFTRILRNFNG